jgi:[ribosomal protein S5]-alanine N-acetyltransferase
MVETSRLLIIPLIIDELELYLQTKGLLEKKLQLRRTGRTIIPEIKERVQQLVLPKMRIAEKDHYLFYTFWIVVEKSDKAIVAELGFKGEPDESAAIEIGYGTFPDHRGNGFMTEAIGGMIVWANSRPDVNTILAETDETNKISIRVLQKNKFRVFDKKGNMLWWSIQVKADN